MARYTVEYERDEAGWWVARVRGVRGCITQGRTIAQARRRIREALSLVTPRAAAAELVDEVRLPPEARRALRRVAVAERLLEQAHATAIAARCAGARVLTGPPLGLSVRDAAEVLGVSHQRVQQLKSSSGSRAPGARARHPVPQRCDRDAPGVAATTAPVSESATRSRFGTGLGR